MITLKTSPALVLVGLLLSAGMAAASGLPFYDGFETYSVGTSLTNGPNRWGATDSAVKVQTNVVWSPSLGTNAVIMPPATTISNVEVSVALTNVWSDFYVMNSVTMPVADVGPEAVNTNMTAQWFIETNGYPVVWHPVSNAWLVCSNDYWGTNTAVFNTNNWMRFTVCQNYSNQMAAIFLNQHLLLQQVRFINTNLTQSGQFKVVGGYAGSLYFDEISIRYAPPNFTADLDNDGMADADEIRLYGSVEVRHRPVITVTPPAHLTITPASSFAVLPGSTTNFTMQADITYVVSQALTNGQSAGFAWQQSTRTATLIWADIISNGLSDGSLSGTVTYTGTRYVPYDYATVTGAVAAAVPGETVVVTGGTYSADVTLGNGVSLVVTNTTLSGNLTLGTGTTGTLAACSGLVVGGTTTVDGLLVISNGTANFGVLTIGSQGIVQVVNAMSFVVNGVSLTGSFTLNQNWGNPAIQPQMPPFSDDFERYTNGAILASQGYFGWGASDPGIVVQGTVYTQGGKAVAMPVSTVLWNSLTSAASSNVWMEWKYMDSGRVDESRVNLTENTNMALILFVNMNNYVTVYNPETSIFNILSNDVMGNAVSPLSTLDWPQVSVNLNYRTKRAAVFLNGRLLAQQLRFINTNLNNCARIECVSGTAGATYLDALNVWTNAASVTSGDVDSDGVFDAVEVNNYGNIFLFPYGSIYKIR